MVTVCYTHTHTRYGRKHWTEKNTFTHTFKISRKCLYISTLPCTRYGKVLKRLRFFLKEISNQTKKEINRHQFIVFFFVLLAICQPENSFSLDISGQMDNTISQIQEKYTYIHICSILLFIYIFLFFGSANVSIQRQ